VEGQALGVLKITGDDAETPFVDIVLTGAGIVPDIAVEPESLNFGQWLIGTSSVSTVLIANHGQADLIIDSMSWLDGGSADFVMAAMPALPLTIAPAGSVELEVVYTPTAAGAAAATLVIASDDPDQPVVNMAVAGEAVSPVVTPYEQIKTMIAFYDEAVKNGTIQGVGRGKSAKAHNIYAVKEVLKITKKLIRCERKHCTIAILKELDKFTDGQSRPDDLITGAAVPELNARIEKLLQTLKTN
jgi:hypothetical protein